MSDLDEFVNRMVLRMSPTSDHETITTAARYAMAGKGVGILVPLEDCIPKVLAKIPHGRALELYRTSPCRLASKAGGSIALFAPGAAVGGRRFDVLLFASGFWP